MHSLHYVINIPRVCFVTVAFWYIQLSGLEGVCPKLYIYHVYIKQLATADTMGRTPWCPIKSVVTIYRTRAFLLYSKCIHHTPSWTRCTVLSHFVSHSKFHVFIVYGVLWSYWHSLWTSVVDSALRNFHQGIYSLNWHRLLDIRISIINLGRLSGRLKFIMGIPTLPKWRLFSEQRPNIWRLRTPNLSLTHRISIQKKFAISLTGRQFSVSYIGWVFNRQNPLLVNKWHFLRDKDAVFAYHISYWYRSTTAPQTVLVIPCRFGLDRSPIWQPYFQMWIGTFSLDKTWNLSPMVQLLSHNWLR